MAVTSAIAAVAGTTYSVYSGERAAKAQKRAASQAARQAEEAQRAAERDYNRANQKKPNVAALMARNQASGGGGIGGTYLTGVGGAPNTGGMLGRTSILGS